MSGVLPSIFNTIKNTPGVTTYIGTNPTRFYPWSSAPQNPTKPYVTYGVFNGNPENYVTNVPDIDNMGTQVDIWSDDPEECADIFTALRTALEPLGHMINFQSITRDAETQLYNIRMEFDFWESR